MRATAFVATPLCVLLSCLLPALALTAGCSRYEPSLATAQSALAQACDSDLDCSASGPCWAATCDGTTGTCKRVAVAPGTPCEAANPCELDAVCAGSVCVGDLVTCSDGDPCTDDSCDGAGGCDFVASDPPSFACQNPWLPPELTPVGDCDPSSGACTFTIDDGAEVLDNLARIYRGASVYYRSPLASATGQPLPPQFPANQGVTPVEGTCCSTNGLGGPDYTGDDLCDHDPDVWSTDTWSALGFGIGDSFCDEDTCQVQHAWLYETESAGTGADATLRATAHLDMACSSCQHAVWVDSQFPTDQTFVDATTASGAPYLSCTDGCGLALPQTLQGVLHTACWPEPTTIDATIVLSPSQRAAFQGKPNVSSAYPALGEALGNLRQLQKGVAAYMVEPPCQLPMNQGVTPVEGTCCSSWGLGGPDADGDNACDPDPYVWSTPAWEDLAFAITDSHRFVYSVDVVDGPSASVVITAHGDLSCDAIESTIKAFVFESEPQADGTCGAPAIGSHFYLHRLTE